MTAAAPFAEAIGRIRVALGLFGPKALMLYMHGGILPSSMQHRPAFACSQSRSLASEMNPSGYDAGPTQWTFDAGSRQIRPSQPFMCQATLAERCKAMVHPQYKERTYYQFR